MQKMLLFVFLLAAGVSQSQSHWYVNGLLGNDSNTGTTALSAWRTIQKACNAATPGSTVHIAAGTYSESLEPHVSGTAAGRITFTGITPNSVFIDGTGTNFNCLLRVENRSYLHFENLVFQNLVRNSGNGVVVETLGTPSATGISFKNCTIRNIRWTNSNSAQPDDSDNAHPFVAYGRNGGLTNLTIDGVEVYNNNTGYSEALTLEGNISGFTVKNCTVRDNSNIGILISGQRGISAINDAVRNGTVSNNLCYNNLSTLSTSAGIYVDGGNNVTIERNTCHTNGFGIEIGAEEDVVTHTITVKNNVVYNNQGGGLEIGGYDEDTAGIVKDCVIRNNTFYKNDTFNESVGELHITKVQNCVFKNNIFYTSAQRSLFSVEEIAPQSGISFHHNSWFSPGNNPANTSVIYHHIEYNGFSNYQSALSLDQNSSFVNPGFLSLTGTFDFRLLTNSPCINQGDATTVTAADEKDFGGNNRVVGNIIDRGAYEYNSILHREDPQLANYMLHPNPSAGIVTLSLAEAATGKLTLIDSNGRTVLTQDIDGDQTVFDVAALSHGIYFARIETNGGISVCKLAVQQ